MATQRVEVALLSTMALLAVILSAVGIFALMANIVTQKTREIGIRMALGSQRSGILRLVFSSALRLAGTGCAIGLLGAILASHLLRSLLFDISPFDPIVLVGAAAFVLLLAILASLLPAQRAAAIDPMNALRAE